MKSFLASLLRALVGDERRNSLEHRLFNTISLLNGVTNLGGAVMLNPRSQLFLFVLQTTVGILFLVFYAISRFRGVYRKLIWPFVGLMLVFLFANSMGNAGSLGGAHYYFVPALVIAVILSRNLTNTLIAFVLFTATALALVWIENVRPDWIVPHASAAERAADVAANFAFALVFTGVLVMALSKNLNLERGKSDRLLLNVLPGEIARELQERDRVHPCQYESASVLFTDFVGFTQVVERLAPDELIEELDFCFGHFDGVAHAHNLEKIKTIGDSYMAAGGVPAANWTHAVDAVLAAFEIQEFMAEVKALRKSQGRPYWDLRLGINSGDLIAGVVGKQKFIYDVWGDTVNTASRMESCGVPCRVNISESTYKLVKDFFECEYRGKVEAKNKGDIEMYFANRIHPHLSADDLGRRPNDKFQERYRKLAAEGSSRNQPKRGAH